MWMENNGEKKKNKWKKNDERKMTGESENERRNEIS